MSATIVHGQWVPAACDLCVGTGIDDPRTGSDCEFCAGTGRVHVFELADDDPDRGPAHELDFALRHKQIGDC